MRFRDRTEAGARLGAKLQDLAAERPIVLGMARGGVKVAAEVAARLEAPLGVLVVRKIGAPSMPEFAIGALTDGLVHLDHKTIDLLRLRRTAVEEAVEKAQREFDGRLALYGDAAHLPDLAGRTVVLVDDGIATGQSAMAALDVLRTRHPRRLVLAVPVCARSSLGRLGSHADEVVYLEAPEEFQAVSFWYEDFSPTTDREVLVLLADAERTVSGRETDDREGSSSPRKSFHSGSVTPR